MRGQFRLGAETYVSGLLSRNRQNFRDYLDFVRARVAAQLGAATMISRSQGRSATAASAYRSAERIVDMRTGLVFDCCNNLLQPVCALASCRGLGSASGGCLSGL